MKIFTKAVLSLLFASNVYAGPDPFIGEVSMFAGTFAPRGWALCNGQLLSISQYTALFSLLGTTYGGDGRTTFALPDLRGRVPVHAGQGPGLSNYRLGQRGGVEAVTLNANQMPSHNHAYSPTATSSTATTADPQNARLATTPQNAAGVQTYSTDTDVNAHVTMTSDSTANTGGSQAHTNIQPFTTINYIIALQGIFPSRN